jgi:hypothetical protein
MAFNLSVSSILALHSPAMGSEKTAAGKVLVTFASVGEAGRRVAGGRRRGADRPHPCHGRP